MRQRICSLMVATVLLASGSLASAQYMDIQRFRPSPFFLDYFNVQTAQVRKHLSWAVGLFINDASKPLVLDIEATGERRTIVSNQLAADFMASLALFDWVELGLVIPVNLYNRGNGYFSSADISRSSAADIRVPIKVRLWDVSGFYMALGLNLTVPNGDQHGFSGDRNVTFTPSLLLSYHHKWVGLAANVGYLIRKQDEFANVVTDDELLYRGGVAVPLWRKADRDKFLVLAEVVGRKGFSGESNHSLEADFGLRYNFDICLQVNAGAGAGLTEGVGIPDWRVFAGLRYTYCPPSDRDGDGIIDDEDKCPDDPEDRDGFEDEDGCPDLDNDRDGIPDVRDQCPNDPEDRDGFEDENGCPDPDNDQDGIPDVKDKCPNDPEDKDQFQDEDGCPDPDNDRDGIPDVRDKCPNEPETFNGLDDEDGCPDKKVRVEKKKIVVMGTILFVFDKAEIVPVSFPILNEVADILKRETGIKKVRVEGHTDSDGPDAYNMRLSQRRAEAVVKYLIGKGIAKERLVPVGYGETRLLIKPEKSPDDKQKNRRVEFNILERE